MSSCNTADNTLTAIGLDKPARNRIRFGLDERVSSRSIGEGVSEVKSFVLRSTLIGTWSPWDKMTIGFSLPWISGWLNSPSSQQYVSGLGDLELNTRFAVWGDRKLSARHMIWANGGVKFPTGPRLYDDRGYPIPDDDQPGTGSFDPFLGAAYAWFGSSMSVFTSVNYRITTSGYRGYVKGSVLTYTALVQFQPWSWGAFALGLEGSYTGADRLPSDVVAPNTGGWVMRSLAAFLWSPIDQLLFRIGFSIPVARVLNGIQTEGPQASLTLVYNVR